MTMPSPSFSNPVALSSAASFAASSDVDRLQSGQRATVVGRLIHLTVLPSGWGVGRITTENQGDLGVNGNPLSGLTEKMTYEFSGLVENHKTYGMQLKVESVGLHVPANGPGIEKFLTQNYRGVGKKAAAKILDFFKRQPGGLKKFREDLLANPYAIDFSVAGVKQKTSMDCADGLKSLIYMDLATRIGGVEVGDKLLRKMAGYLEAKAAGADNPIQKAWDLLCENPYAPIRDLDGFGFKTADCVARKVGFDLSRDERVAALVTHAIDEGCNAGGHTYLTADDFQKIIHSIDATVDVARALTAAQRFNEPMVVDNGCYYTTKNHKAEVYLAKALCDRYKRPLRCQIFDGNTQELQLAIERAEKEVGITLDDSQRGALSGLLSSYHHVHTLTAGPGCGKTALMELVLKVLAGKTKLMMNTQTQQVEAAPYKIGFCAPTGKAAKVLNARVARFGSKASTIHSLLGVKGRSDDADAPQGMFTHDHFNRLDLDLLVVDESSMVDLSLMHALVSAMPDFAHIIFLGDPDQLPSVGPGATLSDLLALPVDHHRLTRTHRNDGGILEVVHAAGRGHVDFKNRADVTFHEGLPEATERSVSSVLDLYDDALRSCGEDFSKVGLLIARKKGDPHSPGWNSTYFNAVLRERYNPETIYKAGNQGPGGKIYGTRFRVSDRVIVRKNMAIIGDDGLAEQVVNGDTCTLMSYVMSEGSLRAVLIFLDDGRRVAFPASDMDVLDFAYAMTVHTAQGSEYDRIIFVSVNGHASFVHRGIVFTAFSRAKKHLTVVGERQAICSVVARPAPVRNSRLVERFSERAAP